MARCAGDTDSSSPPVGGLLLLRLVPMNHNERESLYKGCGVTSELWATCMAISLSSLDTSMLSPQSGHQDVQLTGERLPSAERTAVSRQERNPQLMVPDR